IGELTEMMLVFLEVGGLQGGGVNFDAKTRRNSTDLEDIFLAHIGGMDAFARALIVADRILTESDYANLKEKRYQSFTSEEGKDFESGKLNLEALSAIGQNLDGIEPHSGKQELFENIINQYL
ncbi:MAG: xylose isomerase, partial [Bacteroidota bacterium]